MRSATAVFLESIAAERYGLEVNGRAIEDMTVRNFVTRNDYIRARQIVRSGDATPDPRRGPGRAPLTEQV
jgi:hypothetical protein